MLVRRDLPVGLQAAQIVHAAGESARLSSVLPDGTHAVALHVEGEPDLAALSVSLETAGIRHVTIFENDPPYAGQLMAVGLVPTERTAPLKRILGRLKTIR